MRGWRFAFSRRWAGYLALALLFAAVCAGLGNWQVARRDEALAEIERVESNFDANPIAIDEALPDLEYFDPSQKWHPVVMTGVYRTEDQLLVRNRPLNANPGFEVLTPLQLDDGSIFIVDRGWVPTGQSQDSPDVIPEPPAGQVTVVARLKAGEPKLPGRGADGDQIATVHLPDIAGRLDVPTYTGAYGLMASEDPAPDERPLPVARPIEDEGPHLSYAFQWFVFGIMAFIGLGWAIRQEFRAVNADDPDEQDRAAERARRKAARPLDDSHVEDELLDRQR